jgi:hypothetical protein
MPSLCELYPGICLTTEEKARKNLSQGSRRNSKNAQYQDIHTLHTHTHTLQNSLTVHLKKLRNWKLQEKSQAGTPFSEM